jgi:AraC family transcriptional regulator, exoenzyme S synthesis regulatory protein ExsA
LKDFVTIPEDIFPRDLCPIPIDRTAVRFHRTSSPAVKNRIVVNKNLFSFLLEGEKVLHRPGKPLKIHPGQFLLMAEGHSLMTEQLSTGGQYVSMLLFFDSTVLNDFFLKYPGLGKNAGRSFGQGEEPIVCFEGDAFIQNYVDSMQLMLEATPFLQEELQLLKLEELLLYLAANYPATLYSFRPSRQPDAGDRQLKVTVEGNLDHSITVEELAFLCNMSLSTFKRRFARIYGVPPNKWLLQKRMELAADLLLHQGEKPSEVYHKVGYENHSSFTQSFKQVYGVTPSDFQQAGVPAAGLS